MVGPSATTRGGPSSAHAIVEAEVRELVRRRGIDPVAEPEAVGALVDEVIGHYRDRSITSALPPLGDAVIATRAVLDAVAGFGPLQPLLDDVGVEEIWINGRLTGVSVRRPLGAGRQSGLVSGKAVQAQP